jgi:hypothetical protein
MEMATAPYHFLCRPHIPYYKVSCTNGFQRFLQCGFYNKPGADGQFSVSKEYGIWKMEAPFIGTEV